MELLKIDPGLMVWTWVTFGLLLFLLSKFAFPTLMKSIKERERTIHESLDQAAQIQKRLQELDGERLEVLKLARQEADKILSRARLAADEAALKTRRAAEEEATAILAQARLASQEERLLVLDGLRVELANFVCDSTEKLVDRTFLSEEDRSWTRELSKTL